MPFDACLPKQFLSRCLLLLLAERADHGYDLLARLEPFGFDGRDPGGVYRSLRALEREQLVRSVWRPSDVGPHRRIYEVTDVGRATLTREIGRLVEAHALLGTFLERCERLAVGPAPARAEA